MILHNLVEEKATLKKYQFDPTQVKRISPILQKIISKEPNELLKKRFQNLDGLLRGKYNSLVAIQKATKGVHKMFLELSSLKEDVQKNPKNKKLKLLSKIAVVVGLFAQLTACTPIVDALSYHGNDTIEQAFELYGGALIQQSNDAIYLIKLSDEEINSLVEALNLYLKTLNEDVLKPENIEITTDKEYFGRSYFLGSKIQLSKAMLDKEDYIPVGVHEKTHIKQLKNYLYTAVGENNGSYNFLPSEVNSEFNKYLYLAKNKINIPQNTKSQGNKAISVLLTYRPEYTYSNKTITKEDVLLVHSYLEKQNPFVYSTYLDIKDDQNKIKNWYGIN